MTTIPLSANVSSRFDFPGSIGKEVELTGFVQNIRILSWGGFLILRLPNHLLQVVLNQSKVALALESIPVEATVSVKGKLNKAQLKDKALNPSDVELEASDVQIISAPSEKPLPLDTSKKELKAGFNTMLDLRPLSLRHPRERAIFRIQAGVFDGFGSGLTELGFTRICSPKLVFSGAEGGANVFSLDYFGKVAYLAQSPQFYKQIMVGIFGRVFEEAPVFRAEKHNTSRHVNEYISLDLEMQLDKSFLEIIQVEAHAIRCILKHLSSTCANELSLLEVELPLLPELTIMEFDEVHQIVHQRYGRDYRGEQDLAPEEEKLICEHGKKEWGADFIFVTHYPSAKRPFYAMDDPERPGLTLSFDLLFRGMEITTGGQRLHKYDGYISKMKARGMDPGPFESYLQTFRYGMPPHGGLGFGLERFTAKLCGIDNIKECSLFPRDVDRLTP
jgi:nondiscriminating aspartyl-tRNA synthetase